MFQTTRRRLALWYTTVTAVLLLLFATAVYLYVRHTLIERVDDTLKHVVEVVERSLVIQPVDDGEIPYQFNIEASFRDNSDGVEDDHIDLEWFSPKGDLLWSTFSEPLTIPLKANTTRATVHLSAEHLLRQLTQPVQIEDYILGYLRVSHPWFEVTKPSHQLIFDLTLGTVVMIISTGAIGWLLSGMAMKPVRESYQRLKQFTADASHELRNPIATIQTNVQVALGDPDLASELQRHQLEVIERLTQRLGKLVNDLLFLARADSGMVQPQWQLVHLDALLMEVIEEQQLIATEKGISLYLIEIPNPDQAEGTEQTEGTEETEEEIGADHVFLPACPSQVFQNPTFDEDAFTLEGDWNQLVRLFTNLVNNAVQYTPASTKTPGEAFIQVELQQLEPPSKRRARNLQFLTGSPSWGGTPRPRYLLQVKVTDSGRGICASALPHIFDRFYRADPARPYDTAKGAGLGLAIAKTIVENHHGQIGVESTLNQGTTFTVTIPVFRKSKAESPVSLEQL
ncbi:MAG: sensor histidine kinase [Moorea sp. SIOASIH]|uniref:sensor histidine kinase n=1 Tax=Moorena sp. SIOASIH TaxID=2607817 RepID=UPI0013B90FA3|nr:ATP-binding protein [Moorena sp. SIOASIH]NEO41003.1 sensor histidine kinase [Moorena sp. SIOASIH]